MNYNYDEDYEMLVAPISYQIEYRNLVSGTWTIGDIELEWEKPPIDYLKITREIAGR